MTTNELQNDDEPEPNSDPSPYPKLGVHQKDKPTNAPVILQYMYTNAENLLNIKRQELESNITSMNPDIIAITEVFPKFTIDEVKQVKR